MFTSIAHARQALETGETTSRRLVEDSLARIEQRNPETNAFISVAADRARAAADRVDAERASGIHCGPLHGIPISIKDIIDQAGIVTTAASHVLDDRVAPADALVVGRLEEAGAIIVGRNNLHQFALGTTSEDSAYGPVKNPFDSSRVAGGSSGGSAVAVATGMSLAAVGTDTGASIRVPAALCGVVGFKPTFGDVPTDGVIPLSTSLDHVGPLARTVQDAAWMWQIMSGRPARLVPSVSLRGARLGQLGGYFESVIAPDVRSATARAAATFGDHGAVMTSVTIDGADRLGQRYADIVLAEAALWHGRLIDERPGGYSATVRERIATLGRAVKAVDYLAARQDCEVFRAAVDRLLDEVDALILPTLPIVAPRLGTTDVVVDPADGAPLPVRSVMLRLTQLFNLTGHPAISVPIPTPGLPVGLQLVGRRGESEPLLAIAAAVEAALSGSTPTTA